jgi:citrate-Mg2+:H+ or citrate-Ca2+:H+ symporter, CitMHS family
MLAILGFTTITLLLCLILSKRMAPMTALIAVPVITALIAGFGVKIAEFMAHGIQSVATVAGMFVFAILYFGVMSDAGMFDPLVDKILSAVGSSPPYRNWDRASGAAGSP